MISAIFSRPSRRRRFISAPRRARIRRPGHGLSAVALALGAFLLIAAPAAASTSHVFKETFGDGIRTTATNVVDPYPLLHPSDVKIDQSSHDIYVTDPGNYRVEKFNENGDFLLMFGQEVNETAVEESLTRAAEEDVCPASGHPGDKCKPGTPSESPGGLETPFYLAVDNSCSEQQQPLTGAACHEFDPSSGDVYVADTGDQLVSKFDSSGGIVKSWVAHGQESGADANHTFSGIGGLGVAANGDLYAAGDNRLSVWTYTQAGIFVPPIEPVRHEETVFFRGVFIYYGLAFDPSSGEVYGDESEYVNHANCFSSSCPVLDSFGQGFLAGGAEGIAVDGPSHSVYVADHALNDVIVFGDARPLVTTEAPSGATESEITLNGEIEPDGRGEITQCHFEYGFDQSYGTTVPCTPNPEVHPFSGPTHVTATITGLSAGTKDHYRLVATNSVGGYAHGSDETFITTQPPAIDGLKAEDLTATSAVLLAKVNPNGLHTTYKIEYGPSTNYGQTTPEGTIEASNSDQPIEVHLGNLTPGVVYHYTLVATNADGTTTAEDHTFNFYPPNCPNENVRQQAQANYLPDCRAYELVSPGNAGGAKLFSGGPNTGYATNPARFSFVGLYSIVPNSGGSPIDG